MTLLVDSSVPTPPKSSSAKQLGAYYTNQSVADFLVKWAVRRPSDKVIDPSFGGGVFLEAALRHLDSLGGSAHQVYGVEVDEKVHQQTTLELSKRHQIDPKTLVRANFFKIEPERFDALDAVVGNPPFIRYQTFKGEARTLALKRAADLGVHLPGHASSWAPFLVHAVSLVKPDGRLAMVAPAELGHAAYAKNVLAFLLAQFAFLRILTFQTRLFPHLGEDTFIVLGEAKGDRGECFQLIDAEHEANLDAFAETNLLNSVGRVRVLRQNEVAELKEGQTRLLGHLLDSPIRTLYQDLSLHKNIKPFGSVARIGIGYVTGNNDFFHLSQEEIKTFDIPPRYCAPCVRRSSNLEGLSLSKEDWQHLEKEKKWLLELPADEPLESLPKGLRAYLQRGEEQGVHKGYKASKRNPWYAVPHIKRGAAFLTYMSNLGPKLVHNLCEAPAPNTLHTVEFTPDNVAAHEVKKCVVTWYTSLTFLSAEIEGHSLGGGMLKLEPGEARKVLLALPDLSGTNLDEAYEEIDALLRGGELEAALDVGDTLVLQKGLGLSADERNLLRQGYHYLRDRRMKR